MSSEEGPPGCQGLSCSNSSQSAHRPQKENWGLVRPEGEGGACADHCPTASATPPMGRGSGQSCLCVPHIKVEGTDFGLSCSWMHESLQQPWPGMASLQVSLPPDHRQGWNSARDSLASLWTELGRAAPGDAHWSHSNGGMRSLMLKEGAVDDFGEQAV